MKSQYAQFALLLSLAACGASASPDGGTSTVDAAAGGGSGEIVLTQGMTSTVGVAGMMPRVTFGATFVAAASLLAEGCATTTSGGCETTRCTATTVASPPVVPSPDLGTLTASGFVGGPLTSMFVADSAEYGVATSMVHAFDGGEAIRIQSSGAPAGVPAIDQTLTAPAHIVVQQVSASTDLNYGLITVDDRQPLSITWTGGHAGDDVVVLLDGETSAIHQAASIRCRFDATAGQATIPVQILAAMPSGASGGIQIDSEQSTTLTRASYTLRVGVLDYASTSMHPASWVAHFM